ncbi:hypothetical protein HAX54_041443 [Datura stramonium]|uniref:Uncharacterized protein n=1 Tax=Datura stramonium TaxID=4076 RepID=A0ABS8VT46_DATST|nr:hypothetical protein [Datura stramonium]
MADPVIGATVEFGVEKLLSLTIEEVRRLRNCNKDREMLTKKLSMIQAFIHDVENVFDEFRYESLKTQVEIPTKLPEKDVAEIKENILNMREHVVLRTIPIVGMGGLGKTTVAKRIFNDEEIEKHCEKRVWLCLPEMAETKSFLQLILESLTKRKVEVQSRDIIVKTLQDELGGKKYLLVLDDLWHVDSILWHEFMDTLRGDHCWSIFKQRAFVDGEVPEEIASRLQRVSLKYLWVSDCREFRELPQSLYNLHSLKRLKIERCTNFSSFPVPGGGKYLTSLQSLELSNCYGLTSLPSGMLEHCRSLNSLTVSECNNLVSLPLHVWEMPLFSYLNISRCPKLESVPEGGLHLLTGLRKLCIGPFSEMVDFEAFQLIFNGIQQLLSLRTLCVYEQRAHWDSLPYQLMQLSALTEIRIYDFGIKALPHSLGNLTSLETLDLVRCKQLQHLEFLVSMPKLWHLKIFCCPLLEVLSDRLVNLVFLHELNFIVLHRTRASAIQRCHEMPHQITETEN